MRDEEMRELERRLEAGDPDLLNQLRERSGEGSDEARSLLRSHLRQRWGGHTFCSEIDLPPDLEARSEDSWFTLWPGESAIAVLSTGAPVYCRVDIICHEWAVFLAGYPRELWDFVCESCGCLAGRRCRNCEAMAQASPEFQELAAEEAWHSIQELGLDVLDEADYAADLARLEAEDEAILTPPHGGPAGIDVDATS